ncbi:uncharacterized protein [Drosophila tropicalis]|uniref:uncharacterized protein n=1 Tax=Drosophila tropicalis TaxID=46794 RepID=UPI0035AB8570
MEYSRCQKALTVQTDEESLANISHIKAKHESAYAAYVRCGTLFGESIEQLSAEMTSLMRFKGVLPRLSGRDLGDSLRLRTDENLREISVRFTEFRRCKLEEQKDIRLEGPMFVEGRKDPTKPQMVGGCQYLQGLVRRGILGTAIDTLHHRGVDHRIRALIDSGADSTFLSERVFKMVQPPQNPVDAAVTGMGQSDGGCADKVCLLMLSPPCDRLNKIEVSALVVSKLSGAIPTAPFLNTVPTQCLDRPLADPYYNKPAPIDMITGVDQFPHILGERIKKDIGVSLNDVFHTGPTLQADLTPQRILYRDRCGNIQDYELQTVTFGVNCILGDPSPFYNWHKTCKRCTPRRAKPFGTTFMLMMSLPALTLKPTPVSPYESFKLPSNLRASRFGSGLPTRRMYFKLFRESTCCGGLSRAGRWDDVLPPLLLQQWHEFLQDYPGLSQLRIPRWLNTSDKLSWELHGFCDASQKAYGVALYVRVRYGDQLVHLRGQSKSTSGQSWSHVRSEDNPADLASRGVSAAELSASSLWWHGPEWLQRDPEYWPTLNNELPDTQLEQRVQCHTTATMTLANVSAPEDDSGPLSPSGERNLSELHVQSFKLPSNLRASRFGSGLPARRKYFKLFREHLLRDNFLELEDTSTAKTLGIHWQAAEDVFFTQIWQAELGWDDVLPPLLLQQWHEFLQDYPGLSQLRIPRWLNTSDKLSWELHGFCDASQKAYGVALYVRVGYGDQLVHLRGQSKSTSGQSWSHVRSEDNPADLASRGVSAAELSASSLWWHGPEWLQRDPEYWPTLNNELPDTQLEQRVQCHTTATMTILTPSTVRLTNDELLSAERALIRTSQRREYIAEIRALGEGRPCKHPARYSI